ncbi:MAG: methionyl-tRNA formyltransferase, partial [Elusimicrobiota bacterium]
MAEWGEADLGGAVAYGRLIPPEMFSKPRFGMLNVHFSLLPKYRGAAPVQWALIRGEKESGVTIFRIEAGLDTGPVYLQRSVPVEPEDTSLSLRERLAGLGLELLEEALDRFAAGGCPAVPQSGEPSAAPALKKEDGRLSWGGQSAEEAADLIRGTYEWPQAFCLWKGRPLKIRAAQPAGDAPGLPGQVTSLEKGLGFFVKCRSGSLLVRRVQPEGRKEMAAEDFWNGARLSGGDRFE